MEFKIVFTSSFSITVYANVTNDFILQYFEYKQVQRIVGFSCNSAVGTGFIENSLNNYITGY